MIGDTIIYEGVEYIIIASYSYNYLVAENAEYPMTVKLIPKEENA